MNRQRYFKTAKTAKKMVKNGLHLTSLIAPTTLELEKSLQNKICVQILS